MKRKWYLVILALAALSLVMAGCAAATDGTYERTEAGYQGGANAAYGDNGYDGDCIVEDGTAAVTNTAYGWNTDASAGYRGNGGEGTYSDDCLITDDTTSADAAASVTPVEPATLEGYGSTGALADTDLTLADMLIYALQDEYLAHAEYEFIIAQYGSIRPFTNIIRAEETHISTLLPLFAEYGVAVPADDASDRVAAVGSLLEAYQAGVDAEIMNIDMYEAFLAQDIPDDVREVFESLMKASESHLSAFENKL